MLTAGPTCITCAAGNSPVIINRDQLAGVVDAWYDISLR